MPSVSLPTGVNERVAWSINFETEFPPLAESLGFSPEESTDLIDHVINLRYNILRSQKAQAFSKACSKYKNEMFGGVDETQRAPDLPAFNDLGRPAKIVEPGILPFINHALQRIKLSKNYSAATGQTLMIAGTNEAPLSPADAKPVAQGTPLTGSIVRLEWFRRGFDGVLIESQRGEESSWTRLDRDYRSPFDDERPPIAPGKPEERRYRLRYLSDDEPVGQWSDVLVVITKP